MANFHTHITTSTLLGVAYGGAASWYGHMDWGPVFLGAGLTALGGMLPDLDSDSGVPLRETAALAGSTTPFLLQSQLQTFGLTVDRTLVLLAGLYLLIRFGLAALFRRITVHRGMFHSIPAMLIVGLVIFLLFHARAYQERVFLGVGAMIGFVSHLVLDELCSVDLSGLTPRLNRFAGSALKLASPSWPATLLTYALTAALGWAAWHTVDPKRATFSWPPYSAAEAVPPSPARLDQDHATLRERFESNTRR